MGSLFGGGAPEAPPPPPPVVPIPPKVEKVSTEVDQSASAVRSDRRRKGVGKGLILLDSSNQGTGSTGLTGS